MKISEGTEVVRVARTILADKRPVAYLIDTLLTDVFSKEDINTEFTGSVLDLLIKKGSPELAYSNTEIRAVDAASEIARELEIQRGDGLLLFIASLYDTTSRVIDYSYSFFLPGYFRFHVVRSVGGLQQNLTGLDQHRR
jgi:GntR family transcriptional regulator